MIAEILAVLGAVAVAIAIGMCLFVGAYVFYLVIQKLRQ